MSRVLEALEAARAAMALGDGVKAARLLAECKVGERETIAALTEEQRARMRELVQVALGEAHTLRSRLVSKMNQGADARRAESRYRAVTARR